MFTLKEVDHCLEAANRPQVKAVLLALRHKDEQLPVPVALKLAVFDWLIGVAGIKDNDAISILLTFEDGLTAFATRWVTDDVRNTYCCLNILDGRFVCVTDTKPDHQPRSQFYDYKTGECLNDLPYHSLTGVFCNLVVLLSRISAKIERVRKSQEMKDAVHQGSS